MKRLAYVLLVLVGCHTGSDSPDATPDAGPTIDAFFADAPPFPGLGGSQPQVVNLGGPVLAHPVIAPIFYTGDPNETDVLAFLGQYTASSSWSDQTSEYGVSAFTVAAAQHVAGPAPKSITGTGVENELKSNLGPGAAWGAADANAVYLFVFPNGTIVNDGGACCTDYDGYHADVVAGGVDVAYAITCNCPGFDGPNINDLQQLTIVIGHELVEAVTDPLPFGNEAFGQTDDAHAAYTVVTGGEAADLCEFADTSYWQPPDMTYMVQKTWSNASAAAGHDPCVGAPVSPYVQTLPEQNDRITIDYAGFWPTMGTRIALGATRNVRLHVLADDPSAGPVTLAVDDYASAWNGDSTQRLSITSPSGQFNPGDVVDVPVKVVSDDPSLAKGALFVVTTKPVGGGPSTYAFGLVGQ